MAKTVITLAGISLLENALDWRKRQRLQPLAPPERTVQHLVVACEDGLLTRKQAAAFDSRDAEVVAEGLIRALSKLWENGEIPENPDISRKKRQLSPGELASLNLLELEPDDEVILIQSETAEGAFCASVVEQLLCAGVAVPESLKVKKYMIKGLQVDDLNRLATEGIVNFVLTIERIIDAQDADTDIILNITGGYKGVAPIATIVAMALGVEVCYLYEDSDRILFLPPLEVKFGYRKLFRSVEDALDMITPPEADKEAASAKEFWRHVVDEDREELEGRYVETTDGEVRFTALGVLAWTLSSLLGEIRESSPKGSLRTDSDKQ